jgi:hydrogenase-4 component F
VVAAFIIYTQGNYKRMLAYHSTEHAGIMMLGFGFGGIGIFGSLLHMVYHSFAKSLLFFVSSNIAVKYSSSMIEDVRGMIKVLPYSSVLYIIGFLTMVGIPPFGIFFTESYILLAGFSHSIIIAAVALLALLLVFVGFFSHIKEMLFGETPKGIQKGENNAWTIVPIVCFAAVLIILSVYLPNPLQVLLNESFKLFISK